MKSKLNPDSIFEPPMLREVTVRVNAVGGVNLAQGVCRMPVPEVVLEAAVAALREGKNLYAPAFGVEELRHAIANKSNSFNKIAYKPENILVTVGATGAFESICFSFLREGDEVISFSPFYPYHQNTIKSRKAVAKYIELKPPGWIFDFEEVEKAISPRTKFILVNTPNNPTGKVFSRSELEGIASLCRRHNIFCVTDEVYEYMTYDGHRHISMASLPGMFERTITISAYSKTFAITGWRIGYLAAPKSVVEVLKAASDQIYVCAPTPLQHAVAKGILELPDSYYQNLHTEYTRKRSLMVHALEKAGFACSVPQGAYYVVADAREKFGEKSAKESAFELVERYRVAAVPASDFIERTSYSDPTKNSFFRFCFAVPDQMLHQAGESLAKP